jgi:hypothetical protein
MPVNWKKNTKKGVHFTPSSKKANINVSMTRKGYHDFG